MKTLSSATTSVPTDYATGYVEGRDAAKERIPGFANPYQRNTAAYQGWNDGHYDERSARSVQIERHSAAVWDQDDAS